ncbi:KpsF/GutQ family sugar-phosphate isomerase [Candidatus Protochlamydia phocaeensis]|uniref:KpsF/GutQ family sugar-phosphate isomerase n=1 Tax=Candidatus Protochlamydia phocaeensis TaxID=1414722 RepID=UPI00083848DA|nr:KpsF/GutQ family sugar-phosphate isomerase [Candidatus Protochlamydia phocaeensis]
MLKEIFDKQRIYTQHYFESLNLEQVEKLIDMLLGCKGIIFFTGVGKSGLIAKKIAFTMVSTGTRALYVSPIDALHGDVGMVSGKDIFIMLSKSGESDELLNLVPAIRNKGATLVGVVCNPSSRLGAACHYALTLPFQSELCPFDMAPTMSTTFQMLLGDLLTVALMQLKHFSLDEYALNHPSGRIGKRITLKVKDLMLTGMRVPLCRPEDKLGSALIELSNKRCGCILVADENQKLLGIFTDGDLRRTLQKYGGQVLDMRMQDVMTQHPRWIDPNVLAWDAMKLMEADYQKRIMVLPVIDDQSKVLGLLQMHDIVQSGL